MKSLIAFLIFPLTAFAMGDFGGTATAEYLARDCQILASRGDLQSLRSQIRQDTENLIRRLGKTRAPSDLTEINFLSERLHKNAVTLASLLEPEWQKPQWDFEASWDLFYSELTFWGTGTAEDFKLKVARVMTNGIDRPDLAGDVRVDSLPDRFHISWRTHLNSLEACELLDTFWLSVQVRHGKIIPSVQTYKLTTKSSQRFL